ncbi:hypothetical protein Hanom_Chr16g01432781 [Helianthus anomalus]
MRAADNKRGLEMNLMKESSSKLQKLAENLKERHDFTKEWYDSRNTTIVDEVKKITESSEIVRKRANIMWNDRCKQQEVLKKKVDDPEDQGNPDLSATSEQPPATTSSQLVVYKPSQIESAQGTSSGTVEEVQQLQSSSFIESSLHGTSSVPSSADLALQAVNPITGEILEEGDIVSDLSHEQLLALNAMKEIDDAETHKMLVELENENVEDIEEIVFEGESNKSTYVRAAGTKFDPFDEERMKENQEVIDEQLKHRGSSDNPTDSFEEWRKRFLLTVEKPTPPEAQVDFLQFEKVKPHGKIFSWVVMKEIHCVAIKREYGIEYFSSLLSILSLPFYDVAALTKHKLVNRSNFEGATLFERKIKFNKRTGWKDELYKPQFPIYQRIKSC